MRLKANATYRLQLCPNFGFDEAAALADYLHRLGVSHVYCSPYLQARQGSEHGYDLVDPTRVSEDLGGSAGHTRFCEALTAAGLGQILDVVPNHMAIAGRENPWWWNVLENGPSSRFASFFDINWKRKEEGDRDIVLLPVLGDHYGRVLEVKEIHLERDNLGFCIRYYDQSFPVSIQSIHAMIERASFRSGSSDLVLLAADMRKQVKGETRDIQGDDNKDRTNEILRERLNNLLKSEIPAALAVDEIIKGINTTPEAMDRLLEQQHYRLMCWRASLSELGYRRFFDINHLVSLRMEDEAVFEATHALVLQWLKQRVLAGVRIDHIDGLLDPAQYISRLRKTAPNAWLLVEKILGVEEQLPAEWDVDGTTGYDFANFVNSIFINTSGLKMLSDFYHEFTGQSVDYEIVVREKKHLVLKKLFGGDISHLTTMLERICARHRRSRDFTRDQLDDALREFIACFPVYRSYVRPGSDGVIQRDVSYINEAVEKVRYFRPDMDEDVLNFLRDILLLKIEGDLEWEAALRIQQLTGPAMAKGVEDTAFYCFNRLVSLNEVGGNPGLFGDSVEAFHRHCRDKQQRSPYGMLATSTHDTKRSEDVRARIHLLSEIPDVWRSAVLRWNETTASYRTGDYPDRNTEYLFYQTLIGAWPIDENRLAVYMQKAAREAKQFTSWILPSSEYEDALEHFVQGALSDDVFRNDLELFVETLKIPAAINSLSQTLLKLTAPGIPDIYQGTELWDLSLVDPDNRRPVDYGLRQRLLDEMDEITPESAWQRVEEGLPKMYVIRKTLALRNTYPQFFNEKGCYRPLSAAGLKREHVIAFTRGDHVMTVAPRLFIGLKGDWADTELTFPRGQWRNAFTGDAIKGKAQVKDILQRFPVALFCRSEEV
ncbi:MAG: malto-oligosyltrehalose synthase [Deltaproteobacteria bacterium]|nr:malto-oligosyltrehalose synthase [Deltaproteobacteria bacterium]